MSLLEQLKLEVGVAVFGELARPNIPVMVDLIGGDLAAIQSWLGDKGLLLGPDGLVRATPTNPLQTDRPLYIHEAVI